MEPTTVYLLIFLIFMFVYSKYAYSYWKKKGVPYLEPRYFTGIGEKFTESYNTFKANAQKFGGCYVFFRPVFVPVDLDLVQNIFVKDFDHFVNRGLHLDERDPLTMHLFNMENNRWKKLRVKLTPTFTSGKIKMMSETIINTSTRCLQDSLQKYSDNSKPIDTKTLFSLFTTDNIGSCIFGLEFNGVKNGQSDLLGHSRKLVRTMLLRDTLLFLVPGRVFKFFSIRMSFPAQRKYFSNLVTDMIKYREKNDVYRKDLLHLLLQLKNRGKVYDDDKIMDEQLKANKQDPDASYLNITELISQCFLFFIAGYETSSTAITFALFELAQNQDVQDKLREEIKVHLKETDGQITYDSIMKMEYLDRVFNESLRKNPSVKYMNRRCNKDYKIPDTDIVIEKGTEVMVPFQAIHNDPEYYPNPEKFDPDRFSPENKAKRHPMAFLPFGTGPRKCIGYKLGTLQAKVALIAVISNFKVTLNEKTKLPLRISYGQTLSARGGIWLNIEKL